MKKYIFEWGGHKFYDVAGLVEYIINNTSPRELCKLVEDGYYWFVGRVDDVIKSSGYKISPFEIESVLVTHPAVLECAITGIPDPVRGQIVKATVVLRDGYEPSEELKKELQNFVKRETAPYKYPRALEFTKELPKTVNGKIMRSAIRKGDEKHE